MELGGKTLCVFSQTIKSFQHGNNANWHHKYLSREVPDILSSELLKNSSTTINFEFRTVLHLFTISINGVNAHGRVIHTSIALLVIVSVA
jgi:hypothetical protein